MHEGAHFVVLGCETRGRWAQEVLDTLAALAAYRAQEAPDLLRRSAVSAWRRRWETLLSVAARTALAETILLPGSPHLTERNGDAPPVGDLLALGCAYDDSAAAVSRLPR